MSIGMRRVSVQHAARPRCGEKADVRPPPSNVVRTPPQRIDARLACLVADPQAQSTRSGANVAIKVLRNFHLSSPARKMRRLARQLRNEIAIMQYVADVVRHPHLMQLHCHYETPSKARAGSDSPPLCAACATGGTPHCSALALPELLSRHLLGVCATGGGWP